ncbi:multidrug ABC transporter ATP-binding protein [Deltaproteobacteria bacterium]|nr:multidrug ABC transporter ATP-binding protein [Deltaproteobacteria bacterium]
MAVSGLSRFYGKRAAVKGLDLRVQPGDLYGFLGPNGAGKTTAIRAILGLIAKSEGTVEIFGDRHPVRQRHEVGAMVETPTFNDWLSARNNLRIAAAYADRGTEAEIDEVLGRVGLAERAKERVGGYSLGMRQRLGIARALLGKPKLLVLDEPTNGLDPRGMVEIRELLKELVRRDGLTVFVSSHLLSEVEQMCNRVGILDRGELKAEGTMAELIQKLGGSVEVEVGLAVADRPAALGVFERLGGVQVTGEGEAGRMVISLRGVEPSEVNRALVQAGVGVSALIPKVGTLEELFLSVTSSEPGVA